ncbi:MAG: TetR/AcrR family transcriptional regulator [Chloroflexi bacterium]|nr:TetR/AcrR family transcriptional regulator [Chloroflexota bacterium]
MARTPKAVEDRREQIMDAALRVFAEKGFARATNKDIADEAGITPGLIYHYFPSKQALLQAIVDARSPARLIRSFPVEMLAQPPEPMLRFLALRMLAFAEEEAFVRVLRVFLSESIHNPEISALVSVPVQAATQLLGDYVTAKMESGELRRTDPALVAQMFFGSIMSVVLRRQIMRDPAGLEFTHEQIADNIVDTTLRGLLPR